MSKKYSPRKKYAQGTGAKGMDPNHYIISPAEAMNDYNIMLAKAEAKSNASPWLPIAAIAGQALQTGIGIAGKYAMQNASDSTEKPPVEGKEKKAALGNNNVQKDVEVEGGEMFETPQGQVGEFKGPSHEQGGIPLEVGQDVEEGTKVYSDRLKVGGKTLAERKATRERQIANLEKIASNNLADAATKNAAKRKMSAIQKEEAMDLQFQEQVNNMQAMADNMVMAFGTGMAGVQKYPWGTPPFGIKKNPYADPANWNKDAIKNIQTALGVEPDGDWGKISSKALFDYDVKQNNQWTLNDYVKKGKTTYSHLNNDNLLKNIHIQSRFPDLTSKGEKYIGPKSTYYTDMGKGISTDLGVPEITPESMFQDYQEANKVDPFAMTAGEDWAKANPLPEGVEKPMPTDIGFTPKYPIAKDATADTTSSKEPSKFMKALGENIPTVGDMTKLFGNYLGMTAGIKTAAEQRSTDVTHRNTFEHAGEESQKLLDNAKQGIETAKAQAIVKATTVGRGGKKGARGSARGVNQMRAMDWLYDTALQEQIAQISANAAQQVSGIDTQKSSVAMSADQLKGQGEYQAAMANEAAKDAYYTALGLGRKDFATGMQQTGKDFNAMRENDILETLLTEGSGEYVGMTRRGKMYGKPVKVEDKKASKKDEVEVQIDDAGNKYITVEGKKIKIKG